MASSRNLDGERSPLLRQGSIPTSPLSVCVRSQSADSSATPPPVPPLLTKKKKLLAASLLLGLAIWFCPHTSAITTQTWHLLAIFVATIFAIVLQPLPTGAVAALAAATAMLTKTLTFPQVRLPSSSSKLHGVGRALARCEISRSRHTGRARPHSAHWQSSFGEGLYRSWSTDSQCQCTILTH